MWTTRSVETAPGEVAVLVPELYEPDHLHDPPSAGLTGVDIGGSFRRALSQPVRQELAA
jgi:hypothetical protein